MSDYRDIFACIEFTLIEVASQSLPLETVRAELNQYKHFEGQELSDDEYYQKLVAVIFYSGFRASTVTERLGVINEYFSDYRKVANYDESQIKSILTDSRMIRNQKKIRACVDNAVKFRQIIAKSGDFKKYVDAFDPQQSLDNIDNLRTAVEMEFRGIGPITSYHFLTDIGINVIKPDRVICRIFERLGLVVGPFKSPDKLREVVAHGRMFAKSTGHPIRYIDIVFVDYGQMEVPELGIKKGICLEENPNCELCGVRKYCSFK